MELLDILKIIRKRLWLILSVTIVAAIISAIFSLYVIKPVYEAKSTLVIGVTLSDDKAKIQNTDIIMYQNLIKTYTELAKSNLVANKVIPTLSYKITPEQIQSRLKVTPQTGANIITITVQDENPQNAAELTNAVSKVFESEVKTMMNTDVVKIMDKAQVPTAPIKPRPLLNTVIAAFLGLMVSFGICFLIEYLDNTIKTEDDVQKYLGLTILASIPYSEE